MNPRPDTYIAFEGDRCIASGDLRTVARAAKQTLDRRQVEMSGGTEMVEGLREERRLVPAAISAQMNPAEAGCRFSDLSDLFQDAPATFTDVIHVTDAANQLIARRVVRELRVWDALRPARRLGAG